MSTVGPPQGARHRSAQREGTAVDPLLTAQGMGLDYGAFTAVGQVDLALSAQGLHALIGPNGAGKTSFFNLVSGRVAASRGRLLLGERDITRLPAHERARLGMARSFQVTSLFPQSSVLDNLQIGALGRQPGRALQFWRSWRGEEQSRAAARAVARELELMAIADRPVGQLSHGQQRVVEIGMCLAAQPRLLLLDEPLAGLGLADVPRIAELLRELKRRYAILLVEHNVRVVMGISDRISVMFQGNVVAEGTPAQVRAHPDVRRVYLGSQA
jgi:branched-chain amino acid transport system ATP-binding protein